MHEHGEWAIELIQPRLLAFKMSGPFNVAGVKSYIEDFKRIAEPLSGTRWACFGASPNGDLVVHEALPLFEELVFWMAERGCCCDVMYIVNDIQKYQIDTSIQSELPEGYELHVVFDPQQAAKVLTASGFEIEAHQISVWIS